MIYLIVKIRGISLRTISQKLLSDHVLFVNISFIIRGLLLFNFDTFLTHLVFYNFICTFVIALTEIFLLIFQVMIVHFHFKLYLMPAYKVYDRL